METTIDVIEQSQTAEVRRVIAEIATIHGMSAVDMGRAALVGTELSTNLVKYGRQGVVAVSWYDEGGSCGIQIVASDNGPGFANFQLSARDGHSTGGSLGIGLGTVMRTADIFDVYSIENMGSAFLSRIAVKGVKPNNAGNTLLFGTRSLPKLGQVECGDACGFKKAGRWQRICVVDGLGHGPLAARASAEAMKVFRACPEADSPVQILEKAHAALKSTRGAVMAVMSIDTVAGIASFAGVGNIAGVIYGEPKSQHLLSIEGIVGHNVRKLRQHDYPWTADSTLVMNSDGFPTRWNLEKVPGLLTRHPALIAAVLHRDFARDSDDSTVVVAKVAK